MEEDGYWRDRAEHVKAACDAAGLWQLCITPTAKVVQGCASL